MKKNNKGFTLVELLAVIVVLAIIMVIATQQINKTINRSRAKSFNEAFNIVVENARILFVEGHLNQAELRESLDYNPTDYEISYFDNHNICISAKDGGKFKNVNMTDTTQFSSDLINGKYLYTKKDICTTINTLDGTLSKPSSVD